MSRFGAQNFGTEDLKPELEKLKAKVSRLEKRVLALEKSKKAGGK